MAERSTRPVSGIIVGGRHRRDFGDLVGLAASIEANGLLQPIVILAAGRLVAGQRRLEACRLLGMTDVPVHVVTNLTDAAGLLRAERDENTCRKDFTPSEAVGLGSELELLERPKADARKAHGATSPGRDAGGKLPPASKVRDVVGSAVGMSGRSYDKAKAVVAAAKDPKQPAPVRAVAKQAKAEMDATGKVDPAFRKVQQAKAQAADDQMEQVVRKQVPGAAVNIDRGRLKAKYSKHHQSVGALFLLDADDVAAVLTTNEKALLTVSVRELVKWSEKVTTTRALRSVGGGA